MILDYLIKSHFEDCLKILSEPDNLGYYSIRIDFLKLFESYPDVGDKILCNPVQSLPSCDKNLLKAQQVILESDEYKPVVSKLGYCFLKRNVHARFFGLPVCPELHRTIFPKNMDLGCFLKVTGTVVRVTQSKMLEYQRKYVCVKCKYENCVEADFENRYILKGPSKCGNEEQTCRASTFTQVHLVSREYCKDYQEIKIQEQVNKLSIGSIPGSMWVVLEDDLVDCCKPGDDVVICGTVRRRWRPTAQNKKSEVELVLQANNIEVSNAQKSEVVSSAPDVKDCFDEFWEKYQACPLKGRDRILESVCSQVYGLHLVKLAVLLTVITGSNHIVDDTTKKPSEEDRHATRVRGQCHLLLVGDPGTGKSQLLRTGAELTSRSVFTSGAGSTRAGLTCAALREEGEWQLEAGALVLSDGGVCCIDEISQLREHDRTAIHEAMEQQTISIAKAGIVCKLNTRCAIIAACNPKGRYETDQPLSVNVSLGTPLLSRFDLIFILLDSKNKAWDKLVSSYILFGDSNAVESKKKWDLEKLQMYISLVGPKSTQMTKSANAILQAYYMTQRKSEHRDPSRTTVRMLDSLVRLSQAHCRLMYRTTILPVDAITAITLVDLSMQDCTLEDTVDALHSTTPKYPDFEYLCTANKLLTRLNLPKIWQEELLFYGKLLQVDHKTLENDINNGNKKLFGKFDDVTDDNIQLSASLITSSYFNGKKTDKIDNDDHEDSDKDFKQVVNEKFAATLKKHATLNKIEKEPHNVKNKKATKRKRKEVLVDTTSVQDKLPKKSKKSKVNIFENDDDIFDSDEVAGPSVLNAVPSVNDALANLGIDFNFDCDTNVESMDVQVKAEPNQSIVDIESNIHNEKENSAHLVCTKEESNQEIKNNSKDKIINNVDSENHIHNEDTNKRTNRTEVINSTSDDNNHSEKDNFGTKDRINRLKQFEFKSDHDFNKYEEKPCKVLNLNKEEVEVLKHKEKSSVSVSKSTTSSSQISIFESSDCDIDLDI